MEAPGIVTLLWPVAHRTQNALGPAMLRWICTVGRQRVIHMLQRPPDMQGMHVMHVMHVMLLRQPVGSLLDSGQMIGGTC